MYLVLVAGGHASGKSTVVKDLVSRLESEADSVCTLSTKVINLAEYQRTQYKPDIDFGKLDKDLEQASKTDAELGVVFVYGNYALLSDALCERAQLKVFLDTDTDVRLSQWILRDSVNGKKLPLTGILEEYLNYCRPEFEKYIESTRHKADVLLPQGSDELNIELLATGIIEELFKKNQVHSVRPKFGTPMINLRAEVASNVEAPYYSTA